MALDKENAASTTKTGFQERRSLLMDGVPSASDTVDGSMDAATELAERSATQVSKILDYSFRVSQEATRNTTQNLDILMQCGTIVADGWQAILREWISATQEAAQKNMEDLQELLQCRSMDTFFARQSNILRDRIESIQNSNARISEVSVQIAN
jgi:hypothetical protein